MILADAKQLALNLMAKHGLHVWRFDFNNRKGAFGVCNYNLKTIFLSGVLTPSLDFKAVNNTILHEIAHALVGRGHRHDMLWRIKALSIGCDGEVSHSHEVQNVRFKYLGDCPVCNKEYHASRKPKRNHWCPCTNRTFRPEEKIVYTQQY
jgi:predicted SprT family Zn-dependent metalloprotease